MKADGTVVYLVTEGLCDVKSTGIDVYDVTEIMYALGCTDAILPDGGGSSTYAVQRPGTDELIVENDPTYGAERRVSATLMFTSSAELGPDSALTECERSGHTYIKNKNTVKCTACGISEKIADFSGLVTDKSSGKKMYYIKGAFQTGWTPVDRDVYYFNSKGLAEAVKVKDHKDLECTGNGYTIYGCNNVAAADGKEFEVPEALGAPGHLYLDGDICQRCGWQEVELTECEIRTRYASYSYTGKEIKPKVIVKARGKNLNSYYDYRVAGYENNVKCGTGKVYISTDFRNGGDLINNSSSLARREGVYAVEFVIRPAAVKNLKAAATGTNSMKLAWLKAAGAAGYKIKKLNTGTGKWEVKMTINKPDNVSWEFKKGLMPGKIHQYRVTAFAKTPNGQIIESDYRSVKTATKPLKVQNVRLSKVKGSAVKVKWKARNCTGYQIRYSVNKDFKTYKQIAVKGKKITVKQLTKLKTGQRYYIKVRAYTAVNGTRISGEWSAVKTMKINKK